MTGIYRRTLNDDVLMTKPIKFHANFHQLNFDF